LAPSDKITDRFLSAVALGAGARSGKDEPMITPEDAALHTPTSDDPTWAETNFFGFYVPEAKLNCGVYALFRPNLGVALSTVCMNSKRAYTHWEADYCDMQVHLPMGPHFDLLDYRLPNGLYVRAIEPNMVFEVDFDDGEGTSVHFNYRALMPPFDIHDPDQDPMVAAASEGSDFSWGTAYNGHFDQTGVFEGEIVLRGRRIPFSCVSTIDHSWGPRSERHAHEMSWLHAHFSEDLAIHGIFDFDMADGGTDLKLTHGYVLDHGEVHGLKAGHGKTSRRGQFPEEKVIEVTDRRDQTWSLRGQALTAFPWLAWPNVTGFNALMRWEDQEGRGGMGETQDFYGLQALTALGGS
jgi:hypothetical protein